METYDIAERIAKYLRVSGFEIERDSSRMSEAEYVFALLDDDRIKIRVATHNTAAHRERMGGADYDVGPHEYGEHWTFPIIRLCERAGKPIPAAIRGAMTRQKNRAAAERLMMDRHHAAWREKNRLAFLERVEAAVQEQTIKAGWDKLSYKRRKERRRLYRQKIKAELEAK